VLIPKEHETLHISGKGSMYRFFFAPDQGPDFGRLAVPQKELLKGAGRIGEPRDAMDEPHP